MWKRQRSRQALSRPSGGVPHCTQHSLGSSAAATCPGSCAVPPHQARPSTTSICALQAGTRPAGTRPLPLRTLPPALYTGRPHTREPHPASKRTSTQCRCYAYGSLRRRCWPRAWPGSAVAGPVRAIARHVARQCNCRPREHHLECFSVYRWVQTAP